MSKGLIGSVAEVRPASSKVMLITDPNSRVGVMLQPSGEPGIMIGLPQGMCKVIYLSLDGKVKRGEQVVVAGFSAFFPKGFAVGKVTQVGVESANLYKYAVVEPFEDMSKIEEVVCIDTGK
ncbi:MAG: hypothetical protein A2Z72_03715 [Omnitrophica bacterium RBG_13_46_9]|nr:MAG: hypothetical protein A2Z72_03715 [Omnitrophica bacterium RBG_13_46_9]